MREYGLWLAHRKGMGDLADPARHFVELLVAEVDGRVAGCGGLKRGDGKTGWILRMYLAKEARGRGLGKALLARLEDKARSLGMTRLMLESSRRYQDALGLYVRSGFEACVLDEDVCCDVVMFKNLPAARRTRTTSPRADSKKRRAARG